MRGRNINVWSKETRLLCRRALCRKSLLFRSLFLRTFFRLPWYRWFRRSFPRYDWGSSWSFPRIERTPRRAWRSSAPTAARLEPSEQGRRRSPSQCYRTKITTHSFVAIHTLHSKPFRTWILVASCDNSWLTQSVIVFSMSWTSASWKISFFYDGLPSPRNFANFTAVYPFPVKWVSHF